MVSLNEVLICFSTVCLRCECVPVCVSTCVLGVGVCWRVCVCVSSVPAISSGYTASHLAENPRSVRRPSDWKVTDIVSLALTTTGGRM